MRGWVQAIIALSASPGGVFLLAALDSTVFVALPFGLDLAVIGLAARQGGWAWTVPLIAVMGSLIGAGLTYWMGRKIGEAGLARFASQRALKRMHDRAAHPNPLMLAVLHLLPPPFPFTLFVLVAGAFKIRPAVFFGSLIICRLGRFGLETVLASLYGPWIAAWITSDVVTDTMQWVIGLCIVATILTLLRVARTALPPRRPAAS